MDFKAQLIADMAVFHNPGEFAHVTDIYYNGEKYTVPAVIDHTAAAERQKLSTDHAEGISRAEALVYISFSDLGFLPKQGMMIELEEAGAVNMYQITKSDHEDGEIILELGAYVE